LFCVILAGVSMKKIKRHLLKITIFVALFVELLCVRGVYAVDYYYMSPGHLAHFSKPQDVCDIGRPPGFVGYIFEGMYTSNGGLNYICRYNYFAVGAQQWGYRYLYANRFGSSCPAGSSFDVATGECKAPTPEKCASTARQVEGVEQQTYEVANCIAREQKGPPESCPSSYSVNPINFAVGNKFQHESDYKALGSSSLEFVRGYNSLDGLWRHSYATHLRIAQDAQSIALVMAHGRESFFTVSGNSVAASSADIGVLSKTATGWQFLSGDNEHFTFDSTGRLNSWGDASGNTHQLVYNGSQISVTDHLGNSLTFTEDDKHQPLTLTANGVQITYSYNANNRLTAVNKTLGGQTTQRQFHYEDTRNNALLTGITDERGIRYATWSYDDLGRAISSEHANGAERIAIEYKSDGGASVTNELGKVTSYQFQTILGVKRIIAIKGEPSANCPNSNSTFTYDARGLLKTKTDNKGYLTTYDYNTRGLEVSRTEAAGTPQARTITTDWHPTLFLPVSVTEPTRITTYTYDAQGRQLSQSATQH
jgi:YD repeat-containing protein